MEYKNSNVHLLHKMRANQQLRQQGRYSNDILFTLLMEEEEYTIKSMYVTREAYENKSVVLGI